MVIFSMGGGAVGAQADEGNNVVKTLTKRMKAVEVEQLWIIRFQRVFIISD